MEVKLGDCYHSHSPILHCPVQVVASVSAGNRCLYNTAVFIVVYARTSSVVSIPRVLDTVMRTKKRRESKSHGTTN